MGVRVRVLLVAMTIVLAAGAIDSCTFENPPVLEFDRRPDALIERYIAGHLGILQPTFARSHLVIAWQWLSGHPLSAAEQKQVAAFIHHRLSLAPTVRTDAVEMWLAERKKVPGATPLKAIESFHGGGDYDSYLNCTDDAFLTARKTLRARIATFGAGSKAVASWLAAQDAVFSNCDGQGSGVPEAADASLPLLIRQDRAYQIAAAAFYSEQYDDAHEQFAAIAQDVDSPWAATSALVAARATIRGGGRSPEAQAELRAFLANKHYASLHPAAERLLQYLRIRKEPQEVFGETAKRLASGASPNLANDIGDYTILFDNNELTLPNDAMTAWISNMQGGNLTDSEGYDKDAANIGKKKRAAAYASALAQWRKSHDLPWLVAAMTHASGDEPSTRELLDAAKTTRPDSPAYVTLMYHRLRMLPASEPSYRGEVDSVLALGDDALGAGARNAFRALRLPITTSLDEFLRDVPRRVAGNYDQLEQEGMDPRIDWMLSNDSAALINRSLPLDLLVRATEDKHVPAPIDRMLLVAAFTRAQILGRDDVALSLAPRLARTFPEIAKPLRKYVDAAPDERKWEGLNLIIHHPGLQPYVAAVDNRFVYKIPLNDESHLMPRENWWCNAPPAQKLSFATVPADEQKRLDEIGSGATYLLRSVVAWSNAHPKDPRIPAAMAQASTLPVLAIDTASPSTAPSALRCCICSVDVALKSVKPRSSAVTATAWTAKSLRMTVPSVPMMAARSFESRRTTNVRSGRNAAALK